MKTEKKELTIFLLVAFGLPFLMGIPLAMVHSMGKDTSVFALAQMHYPAAGVMLAKLIVEKDNNLLPKRFFKGFVLLSLATTILSLTSLFMPTDTITGILKFLTNIGSISIWCLYFFEDSEKLSAYGLKPKNWKQSRSIIILFVILFCLNVGISSVFGGEFTQEQIFELFSMELLMNLLMMPVLFMMNMSLMLGEEYGWRYYFQPLLQKKFGLVKGVLVFGVLWGLWHMPLNFFYYAPETPLISMLLQQITCISVGVFFAFAYMKTGNIWVPVIIHYTNNSLSTIILGNDLLNQEYTLETVAVSALINFAIFLPFLFSKVFKKSPIDIE